MRVLVLGASGFVGNQIFESLSKAGFEVFRGTRKLSRKPGDFAYPTSILDPSFVEKTTMAFQENGFSWIVHAANYFRKGLEVSDSAGTLEANLFFPAAILQAALNASLTGFINIGSGWQTSPDKKPLAPNYVAAKESFRHLLRNHADRLVAKTIFVNEVFGPGDNRPKLINLAIDSTTIGRAIELQSPDATVGLAYAPRLGKEIATVINDPLSRPPEYLYENFSEFTVSNLVDVIYELASDRHDFPFLSGRRESLLGKWLPTFGAVTREEIIEDLGQTVLLRSGLMQV